jgi:hypothetical protein
MTDITPTLKTLPGKVGHVMLELAEVATAAHNVRLAMQPGDDQAVYDVLRKIENQTTRLYRQLQREALQVWGMKIFEKPEPWEGGDADSVHFREGDGS